MATTTQKSPLKTFHGATMAEALAQLGGNRQLRLQMGAAARDRVVSQFSLERHIAAWRELLDTVLQRHRVGAMP